MQTDLINHYERQESPMEFMYRTYIASAENKEARKLWWEMHNYWIEMYNIANTKTYEAIHKVDVGLTDLQGATHDTQDNFWNYVEERSHARYH